MEEMITLASICGGAALELFDREFERVLQNIADVNTSSKQKREIKITIVIEPDEDRSAIFLKVKVDGKLAGVKPVQQVAYVGKKEGKLIAVGHNIETPSLFDEPGASTVTPIRSVGFVAPGGTA